MKIRLLQHSGAFENLTPASPAEKDTQFDATDWLDRRALLVYAGKFASMDGEVEITEEMLRGLAEAHNGRIARLKQMMGLTEVPLRNTPPLMVDHSRSAHDVVGRQVGPLDVGEHTLEDGLRVPALYGAVRILGRENVLKVIDGRWSHLSIGADFEALKLIELTITPFPAAEDAAMLAASKPPCKVSELTAEANNGENEPLKEMPMDLAKIKKHLMEGRKMSAEDADKYLEGIDDEDKAKLWSLVEEEEKRLAEGKPAPGGEGKGDETPEHSKKEGEVEKEAEKKAEMTAEDKKSKVTQLTADFRKNVEATRLAARKARITARLSALKAEAKITPAEIKKIDLSALAAKGDEAVDAALKSYADREPVIPAGQYGSTKAVSLAEIGGDRESKISRLMEEHRQHMPFTAATTTPAAPVKRLSSEGMMPGDAKKECAADGVGEMDLAMEHQKVCDMMDVNPTDAKKYLKELMERVKTHMASLAPKPDPEPHVEDYQDMSALVGQVEMMHNQFEELMGLVQG